MSRKPTVREQIEEINERFNPRGTNVLSANSLELKVINVQKKLQAYAARASEETSTLKQQAADLLLKLEQNNQIFENEAQLQLKQLQALGRELQIRMETEIVQHKEKQNAMLAAMQKKFKLLRLEVDKEQKARIEVVSQIAATLEKDVPCLMDSALSCTQTRAKDEERINQVIANGLAECEESTVAFQESQQLHRAKIYELIRELTIKARKEVEEEAVVREQTHEQMLTYVEERCNALESN